MAKKINKGKIAAEIGAGLVTAGAAAAAGYYFYASKAAKKHRLIAVKWANGLKKEVIHEVKKLDNVDPKKVGKVIDTVVDTYRGLRSVNKADLKRAVSELKSNWRLVAQEAQKTARKSASRAKVVGKSVLARSKKTVKKIVKKARKSR
jgi:hypothetical protein